MSDNTAILAGYSRPVTACSDFHTLYLWVRPDADLDGRFRAYDSDECEWLNVNGWLFSIEDGHDD
jgi:hypothetical protein